MKYLLLLISVVCFAAEPGSLRKEFEQLSTDDFTNLQSVPDVVYSVNDRLVPLKHRFEIGLMGSGHFKSESFVDSMSSGLFANFHLSDRLSLGVEGKYYFNTLSDAGKDLIEKSLLVPEMIYPKYSASLLGIYNLFYGKIRFTFDHTVHYDQYWVLGPTINILSNQTAIGGTFGGGFAFWLSQHTSLRAQLVDSYHREARRAGDYDVHDFVGSIGIGGII